MMGSSHEIAKLVQIAETMTCFFGRDTYGPIVNAVYMPVYKRVPFCTWVGHGLSMFVQK